MGKKVKNAKNESVNIDAISVYAKFEELCNADGITLTSKTVQLKDLCADGYKYTAYGKTKTGQSCLLVMSDDRSRVKPYVDYKLKYPQMHNVGADVVAKINAAFATQTISRQAAKEKIELVAKTAMPISLGENEYGYAMQAMQNQQNGFAILNNGNVSFMAECPRFI